MKRCSEGSRRVVCFGGLQKRLREMNGKDLESKWDGEVLTWGERQFLKNRWKERRRREEKEIEALKVSNEEMTVQAWLRYKGRRRCRL